MAEVDINTTGLEHNPSVEEHHRRMGPSHAKLDRDLPQEDPIVAGINEETGQLIDKSGTLPSLDGFEAVNG
jgi:hypothetical protein